MHSFMNASEELACGDKFYKTNLLFFEQKALRRSYNLYFYLPFVAPRRYLHAYKDVVYEEGLIGA